MFILAFEVQSHLLKFVIECYTLLHCFSIIRALWQYYVSIFNWRKKYNIFINQIILAYFMIIKMSTPYVFRNRAKWLNVLDESSRARLIKLLHQIRFPQGIVFLCHSLRHYHVLILSHGSGLRRGWFSPFLVFLAPEI